MVRRRQGQVRIRTQLQRGPEGAAKAYDYDAITQSNFLNNVSMKTVFICLALATAFGII